MGDEVRLADSIFKSRSRLRWSARPGTGPGERSLFRMCSPWIKYGFRDLLREPPEAFTSFREPRDKSDKLRSFFRLGLRWLLRGRPALIDFDCSLSGLLFPWCSEELDG